MTEVTTLPPRLAQLEAEAIGILREVAASFRNPVLLYSIGKDSTAVLHLAMKAFHPGKPPFPLLHIATGWDFREMLAFRDRRIGELGLELLVHSNPEGIARGIGPVTHGSAVHMQVNAVDALKQALTAGGYDAAIGGARRDEEKSRAKERIFSFRDKNHAWEPRAQRPELWNLFNTRVRDGESIRAFPISNWTEFDVWDYLRAERVPIVPLYLAAPRPVVTRSGQLIMVDDDRLPLLPGETAETKWVRFRTMGCYPLTGATESRADTLEGVIAETRASRTSERDGRLIDKDDEASMEKKKRDGYF